MDPNALGLGVYAPGSPAYDTYNAANPSGYMPGQMGWGNQPMSQLYSSQGFGYPAPTQQFYNPSPGTSYTNPAPASYPPNGYGYTPGGYPASPGYYTNAGGQVTSNPNQFYWNPNQFAGNDYGNTDWGRLMLEQNPQTAFYRYGSDIGVSDNQSAFSRWFRNQYPMFNQGYAAYTVSNPLTANVQDYARSLGGIQDWQRQFQDMAPSMRGENPGAGGGGPARWVGR